MVKRVVLAGISGAIVLTVWVFISNGIFRFTSRVEMQRLPNEGAIYAVLKSNNVPPGVYVCNPPPTAEGSFPAGEPVYGIRYAGFGHEAAGRMLAIDLVCALIAPLLAAWLLALAAERVLASYWRSVGFVAFLGLFVAIVADMHEHGIGGYPLPEAGLVAAYRGISWLLCGLVIAWLVRRGRPAPALGQSSPA